MTAFMTAPQARIVRALRELTDDVGYPPSIREIADAVACPPPRSPTTCGPWNATGSSPTPRTAAAPTRYSTGDAPPRRSAVRRGPTAAAGSLCARYHRAFHRADHRAFHGGYRREYHPAYQEPAHRGRIHAGQGARVSRARR
ncbi:LexA family protein [Streptomyces kronopolitis]|uniref:LexA family protein n=1 Tax=Streptomyces kronopolitis TaxID=1612435 RepID=UPI0036C457CF